MYVGLDVHSRSSFCVVMNRAGEVVAQAKLENSMQAFTEFFRPFVRPMEVAVEATTDAYYIADMLYKLGLTTRLAHPRRLRLIAESSSKTDRHDAFILADLLRMGRLPEAYLPSAETMELREVSRGRQSLVRERTRFKNRVSALLRRQGCSCPVKDKFTKKGREWIAELELPRSIRMVLNTQLTVIDVLNAEIRKLDNELRKFARHDERIQRLMRIPGIGVVFAAMIVAEIGTISRFPSKIGFVAYCGLAPIVRQSGEKTRRGSLRHDCNHWLRYAFVEAAHSCARTKGAYARYYSDKAQERDSSVAAAATGRRLSRLVFAMLWSGQEYQPDRSRAA